MLKTRISTIVFIVLYLLSPVSFASDEVKPLHVKVAVLRDFPPQYSTAPNGEPQGFAIDIIEEIARIANLEIEYVVKNDWQEMFDAVKTGQADIIPNQGITEKRKQWFAFSLPVETFQVSIFTRDSQRGIKSVEDLSGKAVAVVKLNIGETLMEKQSDLDIWRFDHVQDALFSLLSGNVDALIFPEPVIIKLGSRCPN
jgi:ABC-type amino acid transport substrate-binding protein